MKNREYIDLNTIYKSELVSETYTIDKIRLTESQVSMELMRNFRQYWAVAGLQAEFDYIRLVKKKDGSGIMMSDTPMERNTNRNFIQKANGDVLIFGLGLGLIVFPLLDDAEVKSITIVELYQDLIDIVQPKIEAKDKQNKVKIIQGDCFTYEFPKETKFDTIYFDIWINICGDNYEEQKKLERRFRKHLNKDNQNKFMDSWMKDHYKRENARERRSGGYGW
ncbi:MAG: class I SAM-dependent methyltransferase [Micavibrio sp.]|nr:class I SAM-dependent methyltransferase [Micavibrio sp.]